MKIAVIGSGISGLGASLICAQEHEVHLFESKTRLGGHAWTVEAQGLPMDVGFLVYNELTYPHLTALFRFLDVSTTASDMSLALKIPSKNMEWCGTDLNSVFGQRRNLLRPSFYRLLREILRFHREAESNLVLARRRGWSLRELLVEGQYHPDLAELYVLPMGAAIWSTPESGMEDYPADTFLTFFLNHKLLQVNDRPVWRTVTGGSKNYVQKIEARLNHVHRGAEVKNVVREMDGVRVQTASDDLYFDRVIFACAAPIALRLLEAPSEKEREVLSSFQVEPNSAVLHQDRSAMPTSKRCWASWNVVASRQRKVSLTYFLNRLQPIETKSDFFLTLNPNQEFKGSQGIYEYEHPRFTREAIRAQTQIESLQGVDRVYFAGAWTRYGFHEDGLLSAVKVGQALKLECPWGKV